MRKRYLYFKKLYGKKISEITNGGALEFISYAIIIYEDFNRPKIVRLAETLSFRIRKEPHTLGVMQVYTDKAISDFESVIKGVNKIKEAYNTYIEKNSINKENFQNFAAYWHIISDYNKGQGYVYEIQELTDILVEAFYCKTPEAPQPLFPIEMMES
ncbi:MAG: hypothetical protein JST83_08920 [Bacteroidetes bacterium]|nr:hypothetical protein [Bacteroidota bacterium]